jgi:hypothetical protein
MYSLYTMLPGKQKRASMRIIKTGFPYLKTESEKVSSAKRNQPLHYQSQFLIPTNHVRDTY